MSFLGTSSRPCSMITAGYLRGKTMHFTRCHLVYFWYRLTRQQRLGFETTYGAGCKCQVSGLLSDFPLQPRHCPCLIFLQPGLPPSCPPAWMTPAPSPSSYSLASSPFSFLFPAPLTVPFGLHLYSGPCCPCLLRMGCVDRRREGSGKRPCMSLHP